MKIVVLDGFTLNPGDLSWESLKSLGDVSVYERTSADKIIERSAGAEIVITNKVVIDQKIISQLPAIKYIGVLATGFNVVDIEAAKEAGIMVTNIPAYSTDSVAQMVFAHILNFTQRVDMHSNSVKSGRWANCIDFTYQLTPQIELSGKTIGIIGFGKIGQAVARVALAFSMKVVFYNRSRKDGAVENTTQVDLQSLVKVSDFISVNCPLTAENEGFVNEQLLQFAKPSAFIINTGRGPLLNDKDIANALNAGQIAGLGVDVLATEPPLENNPLLSAKNCFITPHIAWATLEARQRLMKIAVQNIKAYLDAKPENVVNAS